MRLGALVAVSEGDIVGETCAGTWVRAAGAHPAASRLAIHKMMGDRRDETNDRNRGAKRDADIVAPKSLRASSC